MKTVALPGGERVPAVGQGTWRMGENAKNRAAEVAALRRGLDCGLTLIDTAEMYGEGGAEEVVAEAIEGRRDEVFLVSKVYPHNASVSACIEACNRSLQRLRTDCIDLYLLHWRGEVPLEETLEAFTRLLHTGRIRYYGVSNFDLGDMRELWGHAQGTGAASNQVLYNLNKRAAEVGVLPWCRERGVPLMAYSPLDEGRLSSSTALRAVARRHDATALQVALAWCLRHPDVIVIPKAVAIAHVRDNAAAAALELTAQDLAELDRAFPKPKRGTPLDVY
jgi:diketogulonate reductase-like aldo/keto reductase